jgi:hypothetical protein
MNSDVERVQTNGAEARAHWLALLGYFLLALLVTYPVILHFTTGVPGDLTADRDQSLWNLWWTKESLLHFTNPFHTSLLYYPYGTDLYYHTLALPLCLIGLIPQLVLGLPAAYNSVLLLGFTLSGYGAFRLILYVLRSGAGEQDAVAGPRLSRFDPRYIAAFLGGVVFAFTPYTLDALKGQPEVLSLQWMPLYAEMWMRATVGDGRWTPGVRDRGRWKFGLLAGGFLALAAYSSLYYAVYLVVFSVALVLYRLVIGIRYRSPWLVAKDMARSAAVALVVTLVLALPLAVGLVRDHNDPRLAVTADPEHRLTHSADLLSFIAPPHDHLLFGTWQNSPGVNEPALHDYVGLGYVALALALLGAFAMWRRPSTRFWAGLMALSLLLAMGPVLQVGRNNTGITLPFAMFEGLPGMDAIAKPERFVVLARLCMGVLAGWGVVWLVQNAWRVGARANKPDAGGSSAHFARPGKRVGILVVLLVVGLLVELPIHPRFMETVADLPFYQAYTGLAGQPAGGLMELPFATQQSEITGRRMLLQTVHDKPIMAGYLSRKYDSPIIDSCGAFWGFISPLDVPREDIAAPLVVNKPLDVLNFYGVRYISLYTSLSGRTDDPVGGDEVRAFQQILEQVEQPDKLIFAGDYLDIHTVKSEDLSSATASFHIGAGWYPIEQSGGKPFRWVQEGHGALCVFAPRTITGSLQLESTAFGTSRHVMLTVGAETLYIGVMPVGDYTSVQTAPRTWQVGITQVDITTPEAGQTPASLDPGSKDQRMLTVGFRAVVLNEK